MKVQLTLIQYCTICPYNGRQCNHCSISQLFVVLPNFQKYACASKCLRMSCLAFCLLLGFVKDFCTRVNNMCILVSKRHKIVTLGSWRYWLFCKVLREKTEELNLQWWDFILRWRKWMHYLCCTYRVLWYYILYYTNKEGCQIRCQLNLGVLLSHLPIL